MAFPRSKGQSSTALREMLVFPWALGKALLPGWGERMRRQEGSRGCLRSFKKLGDQVCTGRPPLHTASPSLASLSIPATGWTGKIHSSSQELHAEFRNLCPEPPTLRVKGRTTSKSWQSLLLLWLRVAWGTSSLCLPPQPPGWTEGPILGWAGAARNS